MENKKFGLGVFVLVFNKDFSKILLVKRNKKKRKKWGTDWGNIGGRIEFGETSVQAAIREADEEIKVKLSPKQLKLVEVKETPDFFPGVHAVHFVYATSIDENTKITTNHEAEGYEWFDIKNLPNKMIDSKEDILRWWRKAKKGR